MRHHSGGRLDLLPFSDAIAPDGRLELQPDLVLNLAGFGQVVPSAIETAIDEGPTMPLVPLPLYVLLKLVAFDDRKAPKDLAGIFHCLQHYLDDDERLYGAEYGGRGVPFEYTGAYLLGVDGQSFLEARLSEVAIRVLDRFSDPDSDVVGIVTRERGWSVIEDHVRIDVFEHFAWYTRGIGL
jgi:predicted nucleotidyltransferase